MIVGAPYLNIQLNPTEVASLLAIIQIHRDSVHAKLGGAEIGSGERAVLEHLALQLESTRQVIERALADADLLLESAGAMPGALMSK